MPEALTTEHGTNTVHKGGLNLRQSHVAVARLHRGPTLPTVGNVPLGLIKHFSRPKAARIFHYHTPLQRVPRRGDRVDLVDRAG